MSVVIPIEVINSPREVQVMKTRIKKEKYIKIGIVFLKLFSVHLIFSIILGMLLSNSGKFYYDFLIGLFVMTMIVLLLNCISNFKCIRFFFKYI